MHIRRDRLRSALARYRFGGVCSLVGLVILGLATKFYAGWGAAWLNNYGGDIVYEMFWVFLVGWFKPQWRAGAIAFWVFLVTGVVEVTQLIPFPDDLKSTLAWRLLLGTTFSAWDYPHYGLGCLLGGWSLRYLKLKTLSQRKSNYQKPLA